MGKRTNAPYNTNLKTAVPDSHGSQGPLSDIYLDSMDPKYVEILTKTLNELDNIKSDNLALQASCYHKKDDD